MVRIEIIEQATSAPIISDCRNPCNRVGSSCNAVRAGSTKQAASAAGEGATAALMIRTYLEMTG